MTANRAETQGQHLVFLSSEDKLQVLILFEIMNAGRNRARVDYTPRWLRFARRRSLVSCCGQILRQIGVNIAGQKKLRAVIS